MKKHKKNFRLKKLESADIRGQKIYHQNVIILQMSITIRIPHDHFVITVLCTDL